MLMHPLVSGPTFLVTFSSAFLPPFFCHPQPRSFHRVKFSYPPTSHNHYKMFNTSVLFRFSHYHSVSPLSLVHLSVRDNSLKYFLLITYGTFLSLYSSSSNFTWPRFSPVPKIRVKYYSAFRKLFISAFKNVNKYEHNNYHHGVLSLSKYYGIHEKS